MVHVFMYHTRYRDVKCGTHVFSTLLNTSAASSANLRLDTHIFRAARYTACTFVRCIARLWYVPAYDALRCVLYLLYIS